MWEFPNGKVDENPEKELVKVLRSECSIRVQKKEALGVIQHAYTHFKVTVHVFRCKLLSMPAKPDCQWVLLNRLNDFPMGKVDRQIAEIIQQ